MYAKLDSSLTFQDKLNQLNQFHQALVYSLEPEASPQHKLGSSKWEDHLYPATGQHEDMLAGYLFAQKLIPLISNMETNNLDATSFINYIKQLHGYIGHTLLDIMGAKSGEFTQQQVMRWNPSTATDNLIYFILFDPQHPSLKGQNPKTLLIALLTKELGLSEAEVLQFVDLFERLKNDHTIEPRASQLKYMSSGISVLTKEKFVIAYLTNLFTEEEKILVDKIVKICRDPAEMPKAMEDFAKTTITKWKSCDKQDLRAVSEFLADMFYQFTEIHPFGNANGRTATCLVNVFLRSIDLPSILMRNPGERDNTSSSYSRAIDSINQTREPLSAHIYQRILDTQICPFSDEKLAETITLRCTMAGQLKRLESKNPQLDINNYAPNLHQFFNETVTKCFSNQEDRVIFALKGFIEFLVKEELRLDQTSKQVPSIRPGVITTTLSNEQQEQLKQNLSTLTKTGGWKINPRNHLESWIEIPIMVEAEKIAKILREAKIGNVILTKRKDNQVPVIKCSNINLGILRDTIKLNAEKNIEVSKLYSTAGSC